MMCLICILGTGKNLYAQQAEIERSEFVTIEIKSGINSSGQQEYLPIYGQSMSVMTGSSVFLKTFRFRVDDATMAQLDFGGFANKIIGVRMLHPETGEQLVGLGFLNKAGILAFTIHGNGAGSLFPVGWF